MERLGKRGVRAGGRAAWPATLAIAGCSGQSLEGGGDKAADGADHPEGQLLGRHGPRQAQGRSTRRTTRTSRSC